MNTSDRETKHRSRGTASLTIGQLAAHVGVTVRAIRHYHARGLLTEPARDASGYRCSYVCQGFSGINLCGYDWH